MRDARDATKHIFRTLCGLSVAFALILHSGQGSAQTLPMSEASEREIEQAISGIVSDMRSNGTVTSATTPRVIREKMALVSLTTYARSCPASFKVINGSQHVMWNIPVKISRSRTPLSNPLYPSGYQTSSTVNIPYLLPGKMTFVSLRCLRSPYGRTRSSDYSYNRLVSAPRLNLSTIEEMINTSRNFSSNFYRIEQRESSETMAEATLKILTDRDLFRTYSSFLIKARGGAQIYANFLAGHPLKAQKSWFPENIKRIPDGRKIEMINAFLRDRRSQLSRASDIVEGFVTEICKSDRGERGETKHKLWRKTLVKHSNTSDLSKHVLSSCQPSANKLGSALEPLLNNPTEFAKVLNHLDDPGADIAFNFLSKNKSSNPIYAEIMARTENEKLFKRAEKLLKITPSDAAAVAHTLARAKSGSLKQSRVQAFSNILDETESLSNDQINQIVMSGMFRTACSGEIPTEENIDVLLRYLSRQKVDVQNIALTTLRTRSKIFDSKKLASHAGEKGIDLFELALFGCRELSGCVRNDKMLRECGEKIRLNYPQLASAKGIISREYLLDVETHILKNPSSPDAVALIETYRDFGLDTSNIAKRLCSDARVAEANSRYRSAEFYNLYREQSPESILDRAEKIVGSAPCIDEERSRIASARLRESIWNVTRWLLLLPSLILFALFARFRLRKIQTTLKKHDEKESGTAQKREPEKLSTRLDPKNWAPALKTTLQMAEENFRESDQESLQAVAKFLDKINTEKIGNLLLNTSKISLENGEIHSKLVELDDMMLYLVVFPSRHETPQMLRRYPSFEGGFLAHIQSLTENFDPDQSEKPLVELLLFLRPVASDGALAIGFQSSNHSVLPGILLDEATSDEDTIYPDYFDVTLFEEETKKDAKKEEAS